LLLLNERQQLIDNFSENKHSYFELINCPFDDDNEKTDFIVSLALDELYSRKSEEYAKVTRPAKEEKRPVPKEFRDGLAKIAQKLQVQVHERECVTLEACKLVVQQLVTSSSVATLNEKLYESPPIGLETGDKALNQTALVLRLLHIDELRQLQNEVNRAIVETQKLTANPITNTKLGRVGR